MKKLLVYGFKPYKGYKKNVSEEVVKKLKIGRRFKVKKVILPVVFKKEILKQIKKFKPDIIIGLGQKGRGKLLEMERTTRNIKKKDGIRVISLKKSKRYFLNLKLEDKPEGIRADYVSGDYVCNFTRYIIMDFIKKNKLKTKFAFIHIPKDYKPQKAASIIQEIISDIKDNN